MSKQTEALKLALEALTRDGWQKAGDAIRAIREALAEQPAQQEPVAWKTDDVELYVREDKFGLYNIPLYTSPPASKPWVGLTDVEWMNIVNKDHAWFGQRPEDVAHEVAKLVEAKLREKNA